MFKTHVVAGVALLACATAAFAGPPLSRDEALKLVARPGSWIEADGALLPDGSLSGKDFEVYAPGDTAETEDQAIYGAVLSLNRAKSTMRVLGYTVTWDATTTIKDYQKRNVLSSKIEEGGGVKVQGMVQSNGSFKATKIKIVTMKNKDGKMKAKEKIFGPCTVVDAKRGVLRVLNTTVTPREDATFIQHVPAATP
jgi:hypothetical protein